MSSITDLASFRNQPPAWFERVVAAPAVACDVPFEGSTIRAYRCSGDSSSESSETSGLPRPGVLLVHGFMAHAHCLSFLAPFLSQRFDVVAYDSIGMGDSPMHPNFDPGMRGRELLAVARDAGFLDSEQPTFIVSHSQGGHSAMSAIEALPDAFAGLVLCDMMMMRPRVAAAYMAERQGGLRGEVEAGRGPRMSASSARPHRVRSDLTSILERYQLAPPQPCAVPFLLEYVARHSVRQVADGFVWKFDPRVRVTDGHPSQWWAEQPQRFAGLELPRAIVHGERSAVFPEGSADWLRELTGGTVPVIAIPEAHHHLMLDQPLAFVSVVSALLEGFLAGRC